MQPQHCFLFLHCALQTQPVLAKGPRCFRWLRREQFVFHPAHPWHAWLLTCLVRLQAPSEATILLAALMLFANFAAHPHR